MVSNLLRSTWSIGALLMLGLVGPAHAAPTYCSVSGSPNADGMMLGDMTFSGNTPSTAADDCYGIVDGNDNESNINGLGLTWGTDWTFLVKDESAPAATGSFGGISYTLDGYAAATSGTWTLTATPSSSLPVYVDFIGVLKSSNRYALWFFDDVEIGGSDDGTWQSVFFNDPNNGTPSLQDLSHLSLYIRAGDDPSDPPTLIPEPASLALVGLALAATGFGARRRPKA